MKKTYLFLLIILFCTNLVFAKDYTSYCSTSKAEKTFGGALMSLTGTNLLARNITEYAIAKELNKETNGKFKVKINSFPITNIKNGEFRSLNIKSKDALIEGVYFSDIEAQTICDYNRITYKDKKVIFEENMVLKFSANITQDNLDKTLEGSRYKDAVKKINTDKILSSLFKIQSSKIKIRQDKLLFTYDIVPFSAFIKKPISVSFGANLRADEGKLELCNLDFNSIPSKYSSLLPLVNMLNPLSYDLKIDDTQKGKLELDNIKVKEGNIAFSGYIIIEKNN